MKNDQIYSLLMGIDHGNTAINPSIFHVKQIIWRRISRLPNCMKKLDSLQSLDLRGTKISDINALSGMKQLKELDLRATKISDISALSGLTGLTSLYLSGTNVSDISALSGLTGLKTLYLSGTSVSDISALSNLTELTNLVLYRTEVSDISVLSGLTKLKELNLSNTRVSDLSALSGLSELKFLDLRYMSISEIPESIVELGLNFITDEHINTTSTGVCIYGLSLAQQPIELFYQGRKAILEYYKSQKSGSVPINECKVVFLGDGGVGKTLMIDRLINDGEKSKDFTGETTPGIYISSKKYQIFDEEFELHFWDFGGQEIMHSMHRLFLTNRTLYVVVANARDNKANVQAWYWIRNIKSFAHGSPILLVINQKDQCPYVSINQNGLEKEYSELKGVKIISALEDDVDTFNKDIRDTICEIVFGMESVHTLFARNWLSLMNNLQKMEKDYITSDVFYDMCAKNGIETSYTTLDEIINWYQDLGVCFYSRKHPTSGRYMVLKPRWLLNALYMLVFNGREFATNGVISEKNIFKLICESDSSIEIRKVWDNIKYEPFQVQYIINVLHNFELIFRLENGQYQGEDYYFVPMLCDENEPKTMGDYESDETYHISFRYTYLPENVLYRLMVRHGDELDLGMVWKTGAAFERKSCKWNALVRIKDNMLDIYVKANNQDVHPANTYLEIIREAVYDINRIYGLNAEEFISYRRDGIEDSFEYEILKGFWESGQPTYWSKVFKRLILIDEILGIIRGSQDAMTQDVIEIILSSLSSMTLRCADFEDKGEEEITRDVEDTIRQLLNHRYQIQIAREYTIGRARKKMGETDLYFYKQNDGKTESFYILENKNMHTVDFKKQYMQLMGYLNADFVAGITLSINKKSGWEDAFDYIDIKLQELKKEGGKFAPVSIIRKKAQNKTRYIRSEHIVPESGMIMSVYHLVLQIWDEDRKTIADKARKKTENTTLYL